MSARFVTNFTVLLLGCAVLVFLYAFGRPVVDWIAVGAGAGAVVLALYSFACAGQGVYQRIADVAIAAVGAWAIVAARVLNYSGDWLLFGAGAALLGLGALGLVVREIDLAGGLQVGDSRIGPDEFARLSTLQGGPDATMKVRGPLADSYWSAVLLVVCALVPFLGLSSALGPMLPTLSHDVHLSSQALSLTLGMSNAAYALGTVLAVQLAVHYPQRRLLVGYTAMFTLGSLLAATAITPGLFIAGHVIQGVFTSMMLIGAAPALVLGFPSSRLPTTAMVMNLGIFGAVAAGPFFGGLEADAHAWRPMFWIVCGIGATALVLSLLTFSDSPPQAPDAPRDWWAIVLAGLGCASAFFGASELQTHSMISVVTLAPLVGGAVLLVLLVLHQVRARDPLMPMAQLLTTFCVPAVMIAMAAGAGAIPLIELAQQALMGTVSPAHLGVLLLPFLGGALFTAVLFGLLIRTRFLPLLAWSGLVLVAGGAAVLTGMTGGPQALVLVGSGLVGLGVGSSVAPALFAVGFTLHASQLPRVFAMLELLRGAAAFAAGPIILHLADTVGATPQAGIQDAVWVCFAIVSAGALVSLYIFILGRGRLQAPDIAHWEETAEPAWYSPPLFAGIRSPAAVAAAGGSTNGHVLLDPGSREAAEVEAYARAVRLADGEPSDN